MLQYKDYIQLLSINYEIRSLRDAQTLEMTQNGWAEVQHNKAYKSSQRSYFHEFAGKPIFGDILGQDFEFLELQRNLPGRRDSHGNYDLPISLLKISDREKSDHDAQKGEKKRFKGTEFYGKLKSIEIRVPQNTTKFVDLAVVTVQLTLTSCKYLGVSDDLTELHNAPNQPRQDLTLADAQLALDNVRRAFARSWSYENTHKNLGLECDVPRECFSRIRLEDSDGTNFTAGPEDLFDKTATHDRVFPWISALLDPIQINSQSDVSHFGDDRAYMYSLIDIAAKDGETNSEAIAQVSKSDLFRIAEADTPQVFDESTTDTKPIYNYSPDYLGNLKDKIFYNRHAPHPQTTDTRATHFLFTEHHFSIVTCLRDFGSLRTHLDIYYRHMQFMCVFENMALLWFSGRLSALVKHDPDAPDFTEALRKIRQQFLTFTHVHHFTNVSPQLQAKEMFDHMTSSVGNHRMYQEVEEELSAAADRRRRCAHVCLRHRRNPPKRNSVFLCPRLFGFCSLGNLGTVFD